MKTRTKALLMSLCAMLLVVGSVMGTMAYLTSKDQVVNTFTVGNVKITLDEKDVDHDTNSSDNTGSGSDIRDQANTYHLLPGRTIEKDPIVHVDPNSEDCIVFVKVENGLAALEAATAEGGYQDISAQIAANKWVLLDSENNVYYYNTVVTKSAENKNLKVFKTFKVKDDVDGDTLKRFENAEIRVTAYAVQAEGFVKESTELADAAKAAWDANFTVIH